MKKDNIGPGVCLQFNKGVMVSKTKYKTPGDCKINIENLKSIGVIDPTSTPYKCGECNTYHSGTKKEHKLYGKKL